MKTYIRIYNYQKKSCFYCKEKTDFNQMEKEHVYPKSKLGKGINNKVLSCHFCNSLKSNLIINDFKIKVEELLINNKDITQKNKLENILITLRELENNSEIRKNFHNKAVYKTNDINKRPFR